MKLIFRIFWLSQWLAILSYVTWLHGVSVETDGAGLLCHSLVPPPPYCVSALSVCLYPTHCQRGCCFPHISVRG